MNVKLKKIIFIAKDVYKTLGSGHSEAIYDKAMQVGLRLLGYKYENQKVVELTYKGHHVGEGYPDLVVHLGKDKVILELKAVGGTMGAAEEQQIRNYMKIMGIKHGLLINFQQPGKKENGTEIEVREVSI